MVRNQSLGPLQLQGFKEVQPGQWTLHNDGHSGETSLSLSLFLFASLLRHVCLMCVNLCCQSSCSSVAGCRWATVAFRMFITPSSCTSTGGALPPTAPSTRWTAADTRWRYSSVSRGRRFHWPAAAAAAAATAADNWCGVQGFLIFVLSRCTSSTWRQSIPTWLRRWRTRRAWQCWESSSMSVQTSFFTVWRSVFWFAFAARVHATFFFFFFSFFLQVVYADNVHFGHISQKLSSVAYRG